MQIEELNALKEEIETVNRKLAELTEEELEQVSGGVVPLDRLLPQSQSSSDEPFVVEPGDFCQGHP